MNAKVPAGQWLFISVLQLVRPQFSGTAESEGVYTGDDLTQIASDPSERWCPFALAPAVHGKAIFGVLAKPETDWFRPTEDTRV